MITKNQFYIIIATLLLFISCSDKWDDHNKIGEQILDESLIQQISEQPDLSSFYQYLTETGYDDLLASSKKYTVWAPKNDALASLDATIKNDPELLKEFIGNHISVQEYFTDTPNPELRIRMINGKYNSLNSESVTIEGVSIVNGNEYCRNGVLHIINAPLYPKKNIWDYITTESVVSKQKDFLMSLSGEVFVDSIADIIKIDPTTGQPVYDSLSGMVWQNSYLTYATDISDEDSLYTFIMLTDDAFDNEYNKIVDYFQDTTVELTDLYTKWYICKDLALSGSYSLEELPDTIISQYGVRVPIDKNAIVDEVITSNGMIYFMNKCDFKLEDKVPTVIIEGENPSGFSDNSKRGNTEYRNLSWASGEFDIKITGHQIALFNVHYRAYNLNSVKYNVYWRAVNDFQGSFWQRIAMDSASAPTTSFAYIEVVPNTYDEVFLGEYTRETFGNQNLYLVCYNSTSSTWNSLVLDYVKMVPVFE